MVRLMSVPEEFLEGSLGGQSPLGGAQGRSEGSFEGPKGINVRNGRQQGIFKIVKKTLVFLSFLSRRIIELTQN